MQHHSLRRSSFLVLAAVALSSCGGGSSSSATVAPTASNTAATPVTTGASDTTVVATTTSTTTPAVETTENHDRFCAAMQGFIDAGKKLQEIALSDDSLTNAGLAPALRDQLAAIDAMIDTAPSELSGDLLPVLTRLKEAVEVLEQYDFDMVRLFSEGGDDVQRYQDLRRPDPSTADARMRIATWTTEQCGAALSL